MPTHQKKNDMGAARKAIARFKAGEFSDFLEQIENETDDHQIKRYLYALFFRIYYMSLDGAYMTKSQCCRFIPLRHTNSCKKYMDEAETKRYIKVEQDTVDKRRHIIKPGPALLAYVEAEIDRTMSAGYLDQVVAIVGGSRPQPKTERPVRRR